MANGTIMKVDRIKWPEKSTTSFAMLDFESDIEYIFVREISGK